MQVFGTKLPTFAEFVNRYVPRLINKSEGTYTYGANNRLPQDIISMVGNNAAILKALRLRSKYIYANGFQDEKSANFVIDENGKTANQLLKDICFQKALFGSVDLHIKKKVGGEILAVENLAHEIIRRRLDGDYEVNPLWGMKEYKKEENVIYKAFTQGKSKEVKTDKDGNLLGEILYYWNKDAISYFYPIPDWFAGEMDIRTSSELSSMDLEMSINSFMTSAILTLIGDNLDEAEEGKLTYIQEVTALLNKFTGGSKNSDGTSDRMRMLLLTAPDKDSVPVLSQLAVDKLISGSIEKREAVDRLIAMNAGVNPVLLGYDAATTLGNVQALANAKNMLSDNVITDQEDIKQVFTMLFPKMDWTISRIKAVGQIDSKVMEVLTEDEKRSLEGYSPIEKESDSANDVINALTLLPALVANEVMKNMTIEEKRSLVGLETTDEIKKEIDVSTKNEPNI